MSGMQNQTYLIREDIQEYVIERFIAVGGESIVFKGIKKSIGRTYALKFRVKTECDRNDLYDIFMVSELDVLQRLEQCSASRIAGIIPNVPKEWFKRLCQEIPEKAFNSREINLNADYFCIIEDYIPGCDLLQYCKGDERRGIPPHTPPPDASIEVVLEFQRKLLNWTIQFCDIMTTITDNKKVLHLDIKPENIMVVRETEALMVIDFGKAIYMKNASKVSMHQIFQDYESTCGIYGTTEYAAPECVNRMREQLPPTVELGIVDVRSDIFSFGATLWECINPDRKFSYEETVSGYFRRDLFNAPIGYAQEFEDIIIKCTECNPDDRFQSYAELRAAAKSALKKTTTREHNRNRKLFSIWAGIAMVISILSFVFFQHCASLSFEIAQEQFRSFVANEYSNHRMAEFESLALAYVAEDPTNTSIYREILDAVETKDDGYINEDEADILIKCMKDMEDQSMRMQYVNSMMQHMQPKSEKAITGKITDQIKDVSSDGMELAEAIVSYASAGNKAYNVLMQYREDSEYATAAAYLAHQIAINTNALSAISDASNNPKKTTDEIKAEMKEIEEELRENAG